MKALLLILPLSLAACSGEDSSPGSGGGAGGSVPLVIHPANFIEEQQPMKELTDGDPINLVAALQGGYVIYVGAQVENFRSTQADIRARLIDPTTEAVRREDSRTIVMKPIADMPGWKQPDLRSRSQVAHLVVCPNEEAKNVFGELFRLELTVTEGVDGSFKDAPRTGSATLTVTPTCADTDPALKQDCSCQCEANYTAGKCATTQ
ncbi:MAG: hypothetical protein R3B13_25425 [Polyangiaceae bacterium]